MAGEYPIVLSTGHASREEVFSLIDACIQYNVPALLLNQPANPLTGLTAADLSELVKNEFIWVEQTTLTYLLGHQNKEDFTKVLTAIPRVIYSSDLGQTTQMDIASWYSYTHQVFDELKLSEQRQDALLRGNAAMLLNL
jgi:predicted TIM-barrel fold metal-dependent hydrolase